MRELRFSFFLPALIVRLESVRILDTFHSGKKKR